MHESSHMLSTGAAHAAGVWEQDIDPEGRIQGEAGHGAKHSSKAGVGKTGGGCRKWAS